MAEIWVDGWVYAVSMGSKKGHFILKMGKTYMSLCGKYESHFPTETLTIHVLLFKRCKICQTAMNIIFEANDQ